MSAMSNVVGMGVSLVYVLAVLGASSLLARRGWSAEATRKLVHIALGGWWLIAAAFFASPLWAAALPAVFILVNGWAWRRAHLKFMGREGAEETPGTVYYAVSLTALALFSFGLGAPYVGALGVFCMAFGDGLAAVVGKRFGGGGAGKTVAGSVTMFLVSLASCAGVFAWGAAMGWQGAAPVFAGLSGVAGFAVAVAVAAGLAAAATWFERVSPAGLDNLTVPLGVSGLFAVLLLRAGWWTPGATGLLLSGAVAMMSLRLGLLTVPGALGAAVVGMLAFAFGGWPLWLLLMWFFGSSNVAARIVRKRRGVQPTGSPKRKGEARRLRQVLANSVPFLVCAAGFAATGEPWFMIVSAGALAASTADTWASEIGIFSRNPPVNIVTRKPMQRGLSGGVSPLGLVATVVGAATSALLAMVLFPAFGFAVPVGLGEVLFIVACGVVGSVVDSLLGALLQAKYRAPGEGSGALVEASPNRGAGGYTLVSGFAWVTNDAVNLLSGIAVVALGLLVVV